MFAHQILIFRVVTMLENSGSPAHIQKGPYISANRWANISIWILWWCMVPHIRTDIQEAKDCYYLSSFIVCLGLSNLNHIYMAYFQLSRANLFCLERELIGCYLADGVGSIKAVLILQFALWNPFGYHRNTLCTWIVLSGGFLTHF